MFIFGIKRKWDREKESEWEGMIKRKWEREEERERMGNNNRRFVIESKMIFSKVVLFLD